MPILNLFAKKKAQSAPSKPTSILGRIFRAVKAPTMPRSATGRPVGTAASAKAAAQSVLQYQLQKTGVAPGVSIVRSAVKDAPKLQRQLMNPRGVTSAATRPLAFDSRARRTAKPRRASGLMTKRRNGPGLGDLYGPIERYRRSMLNGWTDDLWAGVKEVGAKTAMTAATSTLNYATNKLTSGKGSGVSAQLAAVPATTSGMSMGVKVGIGAAAAVFLAFMLSRRAPAAA